MEQKIIDLYKQGYGSTTIEKSVPCSKRKILNILNEHNLIPKKQEPEEYKHFKFDEEKQLWYSFYICKDCNQKIVCEANKKYYLLRNLKNKSVCKECSLKRQKGEGNPFYGKRHSLKSKEKISNLKSGVKKPNSHMKKPEYKELFRKIKKEQWNSGEYEGLRKKIGEMAKDLHRSGKIGGFNRSKAEDDIINRLIEMGYNCKANHKVDTKSFDIYIKDINLLVEYNGDYWHCNPDIYSPDYFNKKKSLLAEDIWNYDSQKIKMAKDKGYNVEVVWEKDYKRDNNIIKEIIHSYENQYQNR